MLMSVSWAILEAMLPKFDISKDRYVCLIVIWPISLTILLSYRIARSAIKEIIRVNKLF